MFPVSNAFFHRQAMPLTIDEPSMFSSGVFSMMGTFSSAGTRRYPITAHRPPRSPSHWALVVVVEG
jgi:hypothetical protein